MAVQKTEAVEETMDRIPNGRKSRWQGRTEGEESHQVGFHWPASCMAFFSCSITVGSQERQMETEMSRFYETMISGVMYNMKLNVQGGEARERRLTCEINKIWFQ